MSVRRIMEYSAAFTVLFYLKAVAFGTGNEVESERPFMLIFLLLSIFLIPDDFKGKSIFALRFQTKRKLYIALLVERLKYIFTFLTASLILANMMLYFSYGQIPSLVFSASLAAPPVFMIIALSCMDITAATIWGSGLSRCFIGGLLIMIFTVGNSLSIAGYGVAKVLGLILFLDISTVGFGDYLNLIANTFVVLLYFMVSIYVYTFRVKDYCAYEK